MGKLELKYNLTPELREFYIDIARGQCKPISSKLALDYYMQFERFKIQLLLIVYISEHPGKTAAYYARKVNVSRSMIYRTVQEFNKNGRKFFEKHNSSYTDSSGKFHNNKWGGSRAENRYFSELKEAEILFYIKGIVLQKESGYYKIVTAKQVKEHILNKYKIKVSDSYVLKLLKRHHWERYIDDNIYKKYWVASLEMYMEIAKRRPFYYGRKERLSRYLAKYWTPSQE